MCSSDLGRDAVGPAAQHAAPIHARPRRRSPIQPGPRTAHANARRCEQTLRARHHQARECGDADTAPRVADAARAQDAGLYDKVG